MPKYHELPPDKWEPQAEFYRRHLEVLRVRNSTAGQEATTYLWATNGGASVALLAFMGSNASVRASSAAWVSLMIFFLGIVALGILRALAYHFTLSYFKTWLRSVDEVFANQIDINEPAARLNAKEAAFGYWPTVFGYVSFFCFIAGCIWLGIHWTGITTR